MQNFIRSLTLLAAALLLGGIAIKSAHAHAIDRIEISQAGEEAEIHIIFDVRIQYLREASLDKGEVHVFINLLEPDPERTRLVPESKESPPSDIAPHFSVAYPALDSSLTIKFDKAVSYRVTLGKNGRSISIFIPVIKTEIPAFLPFSAAHTPEEVEREAKQLIDSANDSLGHGQLETAIETLNRLLNLPPNQQSQVAQKLVGEAREKSGEYAKARVEYELYLKLYPDAADTKQVKDRLAQLPEEAKAAPGAAQKKFVEEKMTVFGSFSQNYYTGMSHIETTTANGLNVTKDTLDSTDQSMLITTLDLTGRKRTATTDTRIVVRDDYSANFLSKTINKNRLNSFYVEQSARDHSYMYRLGRQRGVSGGVPGRFDGAWLGYSPNSAWRVNGVAGTPVEFYGNDIEKKTFAGLSVDLTRLPEQWSGSGYYIEQRVGKIVDRQAVGMEAHYFDAQSNYMEQLEYDRLFKVVNIAMLQGNWTTGAGDNYTLLADHRKTPPLQITNALPGQSIQSVAALVQSGVSAESLRKDARALTQTSNLLMAGMTHPFSARWRLGGDFRVNNISGTGAVGPLPASNGTGNFYIYSAQAIGNSLLLENDLGVASASYINAQTYKGQSLAYTQSETLRQRWRLDVSLQLYSQKDNQEIRQQRTAPSIKLSYRLNESVTFDSEGGIEDTKISSATQTEKTRRRYVYLGYRWDFR